MPQRVLNIQSDAATRERVRRLLEAIGIDVDESATGLDGIEKARSSPPDLVLADTELPDIAGVELATRLKRERALAQVPFVAVGHSSADQEVALAAGWDGFIVQPLDDARFAAEVRSYLAGRRERPSTLDPGASAFIHGLAHELSTPLTPLSGYLKILTSGRLGELAPQQRKVVDGIASAVAKLTRIVDNLSDLASLEAGPAAITRAPVDPDLLAAEVVDELASAARDGRVHVDVQPSRGGLVLADGRKLRQALLNVVGNAVKFSPHGGEVLVHVCREEGRLRIGVYDQGPGVAARDHERVFQPFRSPRSAEARRPGSGLGLPVARRIAEAHGGGLSVESPPKAQPIRGHHYTGAKFILDIPVEAVPVATPPPAA